MGNLRLERFSSNGRCTMLYVEDDGHGRGGRAWREDVAGCKNVDVGKWAGSDEEEEKKQENSKCETETQSR